MLCVHGLYMSTVHFHTRYLSTTQSMPSFCWPIHVYFCVSTVCVVCQRSAYVHCSLSYTHTTSLARSQCVLSAGQFLCVHSQWCVSTVCICPLFTFIHALPKYHSVNATLPKYHSVNAFSLLANSCVSTVSSVCPRSVYVPVSYTHLTLPTIYSV